MTPEALRRLALALPEAHEEPHFERTSFRVGKKIFATMTADGREAMTKLPVADDAEALIASAPEVFFSYGTWTTKNGALGVRLARVPAATMKRLVTEAWSAIAPKRAREALRPRKKETR
jgi:hypothetical protein